MKKLFALLLAVMMVVGVFAGCGKTDTPDATTQGGTQAPVESQTGPDGRVIAKEQVYRTMYTGEVETMNYLSTGNTNDLVVGANVIDSLVENDTLGNIVPAAAESWDVSDDGLTWTFHLRQGQYWYDAEGNQMDPVTAKDFVASLQYVCNAENDAANFYMVDGWIVNATEYYDYTTAVVGGFKNEAGQYLDHDPAEDTAETPADEKAQPVAEVKPEDIGIVAVDDYTLEYHLVIPRPYFVTALQYGCYWPAPATLLEQLGTNFALDNTSMWFNGAYIMSTFEPQAKRIYTKNANYWDKEHVYIEEIRQTYNAESTVLAPEMFARGDIDYCAITSELLPGWKADATKSQMISPTRVTADYSYFFCFNFEPRFGAEYEPENWTKAVNSENFRQSIFWGLDRVNGMKVVYPDNAEDLIINTVTPTAFAMDDKGVDYTTYGDLAAIRDRDSFNSEKALEFKKAAVEELKAAGATLPIKIPFVYNSSMNSWGQECSVIEQQLEGLLGTDYIDIIVVAGPSQGFLGAVRRAGQYALLKCNWGADYADPETWTDPFVYNSSYNFAYDTTEKLEMNTKSAATKAINDEYDRLVKEAKSVYFDTTDRYTKFAAAEAYYINHAMIIPYGVSGGDYQATKLNLFEGQYAPFGQSSSRYKGQHVYETAMTTEMFNTQLATWQEAIGIK